jgi:transcriptional regulator with XRE-family HTH domain
MTTTPDPIDVEIGRRICSRRLFQDRTQSDLAKACGITFQQIQKYETGANRVSGSRLHQIAIFLGCQVADFFPPLPPEEAALDPATVLGATRNGHELARLYVAMSEPCRASVLNVARAIVGATAEAAATTAFDSEAA